MECAQGNCVRTRNQQMLQALGLRKFLMWRKRPGKGFKVVFSLSSAYYAHFLLWIVYWKGMEICFGCLVLRPFMTVITLTSGLIPGKEPASSLKYAPRTRFCVNLKCDAIKSKDHYHCPGIHANIYIWNGNSLEWLFFAVATSSLISVRKYIRQCTCSYWVILDYHLLDKARISTTS